MKYSFILLLLISFSAYSQTFVIPSNGKPLTVKCSSGKVYDNGGTSTVIPNSDGTITIKPAEKNKIIRLEIDSLEISGNDTLLIYQGALKNYESLIGKPEGVFLGITPIYYGSEKDGSITIEHKTKNNPFNKKGLVASISCIDKMVSFDFRPEKIMLSKGLENRIRVYMLISEQKEKAPSFKINIYYSKDKVLDKSDVLGGPLFVNTLQLACNLNADTKIPDQLEAGDYYIIAELDPGNLITETNEKNNIIVSESYKIEK